jgi:hypothetical protein
VSYLALFAGLLGILAMWSTVYDLLGEPPTQTHDAMSHEAL